MSHRISQTTSAVLSALLSSILVIFSTPSFADKPLAPAVIEMHDSYFSPATITVQPGQKVIWVNKGEKDHTVTGTHGDFDSGRIRPGAKISKVFTQSGTYSYKCTIHTLFGFGMNGKVIVK